MLPDLLNFIDENGLKIMLDLKGWTYNSSALIINNLAVVKPDFYPDRHVLARGKKGYIYASGETRISYAGREFNSVGDLLAECGETVMNDYKDWVFLEEKEWVLTDGNNWLASFSTLDKLPKRTTYRC
tara:strand:+ start:1456 stop:1839 length:384 start_codon:yes stop_codon:yes gene_type:complete